jgi:hypothetical protein
MYAENQDCEARRESRYYGTALQILPLLGDDAIKTSL